MPYRMVEELSGRGGSPGVLGVGCRRPAHDLGQDVAYALDFPAHLGADIAVLGT
ncbi:hypothetical protein OH738_40120 [Streptomyces hirsutus]|uniref:Uncharacterized protein n=1 Tax=Streptomyces hirsutus TaxID=35620 RepID=A0ABZ1GYH1_9ACTN|nr:hypothetical protein [Streptomyces hirsutus]WSD11212.1 hypothetical protein OIE73_39895 [Streptomyces hirsutus]WTD15433.1 hypothetical protein OH738_00060 [Streptomyces hirsutus]WTD22322.1 hypothetical protein OH738_40120 [Streptomyces hirsutus]